MRDIQKRRTRAVTTLLLVWMVGALTPLLVAFLATAVESRGDRAAWLRMIRSGKSNSGQGNSPAPVSTVSVPHNGSLKFSYQWRERFRNASEAQHVRASREAIIGIINQLKDQMALPFDVSVSVEKCNDGAFYDGDSHNVTICYELIDTYYYLFASVVKGRAKLDEAVRDATVAVFLHELGHAAIDAWDLPITGREEDAADQFATLLMINGLDDGERMALNGARSLKLFANLEKRQAQFHWDEHSPDEQRFYDELCLIYGRSPDKYSYLLQDGDLPPQRAEQCEEDYVRLRKSWRTLLAPYAGKAPLRF